MKAHHHGEPLLYLNINLSWSVNDSEFPEMTQKLADFRSDIHFVWHKKMSDESL